LQWVLEGGHGASAPDELVLNRDGNGRTTGLAYYGAQLVVAADDGTTLDAFAVETRKHRGLRSFVGEKDAVDGLWKRVRTWHPRPSIVRAAQPLYLLVPEALPETEDVEVRRATLAESELVAENSAAMILGELGYDPRANRPSFLAGIRRSIALGAWWVWVVDGALRFQCNVGPRSTATAQIQGVWTPPELRGRAYATLGLAAIARRLLETEATLSLYVNDFNEPAIALYERLGFRRIGTFATYLFS
jgi:predicted GNAT family acetyltransferase